MTRFEFNKIENDYSRALDSVRYLSELYLTLKDLLNINNPNKKHGPAKFAYNYGRDDSTGVVTVFPGSVKTFDIVQRGGYRSPEDWVYESFPNGVGWMHPYDIKSLPEVLKLVKRLKKVADYKFTRASEAMTLAYAEQSKGLENDPVDTLQKIINYTSVVGHDDKVLVKEFLKGKGIEV